MATKGTADRTDRKDRRHVAEQGEFNLGPMDDGLERKLAAIGGKRTLTAEDLKDFGRAERRIFALMSDGDWYAASEIVSASRQREGLRRLRSLRGRGLVIACKRLEGRREFAYRIVFKAGKPAIAASQPTARVKWEHIQRLVSALRSIGCIARWPADGMFSVILSAPASAVRSVASIRARRALTEFYSAHPNLCDE